MKIELTKRNNPGTFENVYCVLQAMRDRKSPRAHLHHVLINDDEIVGTDGNTLHACKKLDEWEVGLYDVIKITKGQIILLKTHGQDGLSMYPDYKRILDDKENRYCIDHMLFGADNPEAFTSVATMLPEGMWINPRFIEPFNGYFNVTVKNNGCIIISNDNLTAAIMCGRYQDDY